jgi:hypothetical protein
MQFEDFDKKVREAADHYYPAYDEKAWTKMDKLLNRHLPQKEENKRRLLFLLLFFVLLGGGAWLLIDKPWQNEKTQIVSGKTGTNEKNKQAESSTNTIENKNTVQPVSGGNASTNGNTNTVTEGVSPNGTEKVQIITPVTVPEAQVNRNTIQKADPKNSAGREPVVKKTSQAQKPITVTNTSTEVLKQGNKKLSEPGKPDPVTIVSQPVTDNKNNTVVVPAENKPAVDIKTEAEQPKVIGTEMKVVPETAKTADPVAKKTKEKNTSKSSFFFSVSAGPDVSAVRAKNAGDTKLLTGVGIGYSFFKEKLSVRTGFYGARKVYTASPKDYQPKEPVLTPEWLTKIDANCKVYEIPLNLSYNFLNTAKQQFFAGAGLSSYIMKKEVYDYEYVYPGGPPFTYTHTVDNKNKHYFSVLNVSAGYTRKFGKTFSVTAEPYVKLPLKGVGYGNVKLNSAGILVSLNIRPFNAKEAKPMP